MTIAFLAWAVAFNIEADKHRGIVYATWPDQECQHVRPVSSALDQRRGPSLLSGQACEVAQFFRIIDEQADRMDSLIGDLLDAGRIDTGTLSVAPEPSDVAVLVDQARGTFISGGGRHTVRIDLPPDLPRVMADRQRLVQVLNNLLANATRRTPRPSGSRRSARGCRWRSRSPTRAGASRRTSSASCSASTPPPGTGRAASVAGWASRSARAWSKPRGGASGPRAAASASARASPSRSRWPRRPATVPPQPAPGPPGHAPDAVPILVVDDDPETLRHLRDTLAEAGYAPLVTGDPGELARLIRAEKPQLVLLDLMLPGTNGVELMQTVPELADLPVIFISGYGRDETIARALEAGAEEVWRIRGARPITP